MRAGPILAVIALAAPMISGCGGSGDGDGPGGGPLQSVQIRASSLSVAPLEQVKLEALVTGGNGPLFHTWTVDSNVINDPNGVVYFSRYVSTTRYYTVKVSVSDGKGVVESSPVTIKVSPSSDGGVLRVRNGANMTIDELYVYMKGSQSRGLNLLGSGQTMVLGDSATLWGLINSSYYVGVHIVDDPDVVDFTNGAGGYVAHSSGTITECVIYFP